MCCDAANDLADAPPLDPSSEACGACHGREYAAWRESPHGRSSDSPVFAALVKEVRSSWGDAAARRCESCHAPGHDGSDRVGCVSCHQAVGNRGARDGLLVVDLAAPIAAPHAPSAAPPHATRPGDLLASPVLCATCHVLTGPEHFVEGTYDEYLASPAAAAGLTCQSCHLPRREGRTDHGLTSVTPPWGRGGASLAGRRDAIAGMAAGAIDLGLERADDGGVRVYLTNARAGHAIPTGATLVRELWVEVRGADAAVARAITLGARLTADGVGVALPTEADTVVISALAPGETASRTLALTPPVEATLYLRPVRADAAEALGFDPDEPELAPIVITRTRLD
ncbi:MAG: hypothetical protein CVU56_14440 [Deltaproteobacteria bacterium HGW-Deltaproteobacteria-14]|nr:MAG: hypothetical protein CVU56_14440 [Deltaproteobacteria bacterium HGW-Deltaproteobacteria-14]